MLKYRPGHWLRWEQPFLSESFLCGHPNLLVWGRITPSILTHNVLELCRMEFFSGYRELSFSQAQSQQGLQRKMKKKFLQLLSLKNFVCGSSVYLKLTIDCVLVIMITVTFIVTASWLLSPLCGRMAGNSRDYRIRLCGFKLLTVCNTG